MSARLRAPRLLGESTDPQPVIVIDSREQEPLVFPKFEAIQGTLTTGDYSVVGLEHLFAIERKSIADLVACCCAGNRERFERELHRLRGFRFKRLLVVGSEADILQGNYRSQISANAVLATLGAFEVRYDLPLVFEATPEAAARRVERWVYWYAREATQTAAKLSKAAEEVGRK